MLRSIGAVVFGFFLIAFLSFAADFVLRMAMPGVFDEAGRVGSVPVLLLVQGYVGVFAITGCYAAARLAPGRPMLHALVLGLLGLVFNVIGTVVMWNTAPVWYHVMALALVMPYAWIGGRLGERSAGRGEPPAAVRPAL